jgi:hypothetical protein
MKIYIDELNLDIINDISDLFKEYLVEMKKYSTIYTDDRIYLIEKNNVYKLDTVDREIKLYNKYYENFDLIVDKSYFNKQQVTSIHGFRHYYFYVNEYSYKINKTSNIKLVIKDKRQDYTRKVYDIYFETEKDIDIDELFFKKELTEFLSVFN